MALLARCLMATTRQTCVLNGLANSFRSLSMTPRVLQPIKPALVEPVQAPTISPADEQKQCQEVFDNVNQQLSTGNEGRLFAVVQLCGKQFKITTGDIILVEGYWPPTIGDEILLDKVLLAGARDFTVIGRPILDIGLVRVKATIIEKTLAHTRTHFKKKRRKQFMRINFQRSPNTMIRINSIEFMNKVDADIADPNKQRLF